MAGICGFANCGEKDVDRLKAMQSLMADPASSGKVDFFHDGQLNCAIDPPKGSAGSVHVDHDIIVWVDGEIYDFGSGLNGLDAKDGLATIICNHYRENGLAFFKKVDGVFATVIYDRAKQQVHLVNDRYGLRHLYFWYSAGGGLVWASKVRAFLEAPGFQPRINRAALNDFIEIGYLLEDKTWFEGVSMLPTASFLTCDIRTGRATLRRYWWWDEIKPLTGPIDEDAIAEELADRFVHAVEKRARPNERVGLCLSGGLDSRALLAAIPSHFDPVQAVTFGADGCQDRILAARAAAVRHADSHHFALNSENWWLPRISGVWLSDGQHDLMHMHGLEAESLIRRYFHIDMCGFGGDSTLGGSYLRSDELDCSITAQRAGRYMGCKPDRVEIGDHYSSLKKMDYYYMQNRVRRFLYGAVALSESLGLPCRLPFIDNRLIDLVFSLPDDLRFKSRIYRKMLLRRFPEYFKSIPWQKTGIPIGYSDRRTKLIQFGWRARHKLFVWTKGAFADPYASWGFTNYDEWIRKEPARSFLDGLINSDDALYPSYISKEAVKSDWESHLAGKSKSQVLCRYATMEIWLQQVFNKNLRPTW